MDDDEPVDGMGDKTMDRRFSGRAIVYENQEKTGRYNTSKIVVIYESVQRCQYTT